MLILSKRSKLRKFILELRVIVIGLYFLFNSLPVNSQAYLPSSATLLVIDVQNCFIEGGSLPVSGGAQVIPVINSIAPLFENIVVTQDWHPVGHISFASTHPNKNLYETVKLSYGEQILWPDHCMQATADASLHPDLNLPKTQLILRKGFHKDVDSYSAFIEADRKTSTGLAAYLRGRNIDTVYIAGLATDFCVAWSALDAREAGFSVYVIEDATRGINSGASLDAVWLTMTSKGVNRIQSAQINGR